MKSSQIKRLFLFTGILVIFGTGVSPRKREDVRPFAPVEVFPSDTSLSALAQKRAMILIAHDDDMCAMTGTISLLNKNGWDIRVVSLPKGESREKAHRKACRYILDSVLFFSITAEQLRIDAAENQKLWGAIPKEKFNEVFNVAELRKQISEHVNQFRPSVIFTLDNEIGGYGHPEHVLMSQTVLDLSKEGVISPVFIYQSVYTDHMENSIMERHRRRLQEWGFPGDDWDKAKQTYGVSGMPEPSVQIQIVKEAQAKVDYLLSYNKRERKTMGFFIPAFEEYSAEEYFSIFDREFFRVIQVN